MFAESVIARNHHKYLNQKSTNLVRKMCVSFPFQPNARVEIRTKDTAIVPSSQPSPDLLEIRFQNLIKTKMGVTTKNTMLGIRTMLAWLWAASSGVRNAIAQSYTERARQLESNNNTRADEMREKKNRDIQKGGFGGE